mmetsp:Transcript_30900/g.90318  ORF Transcript_30900/g.90318 Transcript_30900/m.90318 type:complete len:221 (-) Transcript_30900:299-961(-)
MKLDQIRRPMWHTSRVCSISSTSRSAERRRSTTPRKSPSTRSGSGSTPRLRSGARPRSGSTSWVTTICRRSSTTNSLKSTERGLRRKLASRRRRRCSANGSRRSLSSSRRRTTSSEGGGDGCRRPRRCTRKLGRLTTVAVGSRNRSMHGRAASRVWRRTTNLATQVSRRSIASTRSNFRERNVSLLGGSGRRRHQFGKRSRRKWPRSNLCGVLGSPWHKS